MQHNWKMEPQQAGLRGEKPEYVKTMMQMLERKLKSATL